MANRTGPVTTLEALAVASQFGITLAVSVVLGYFAGQWLDDRLGTRPIFTLIGVLLGLVAAVLNTIRLYNALMRKSQPRSTPQPHTQGTTASVHSANDGRFQDEDEGPD